MLEFMSHSCFLSFKIRAVVFVWFNHDRDIFNDGQSIAFQADTLDWVIGDETKFADSHFSKNLCSNAIFAFVGSETEMDVSIYCIVAFKFCQAFFRCGKLYFLFYDFLRIWRIYIYLRSRLVYNINGFIGETTVGDVAC